MYRFVFKDNGWWLKISSIEELDDYYNKVDNMRASDCFEKLINSREFGAKDGKLKPHADAQAMALGFYAINRKLNPIEATLMMQEDKYKVQSSCLDDGDSLYINSVGGWHSGSYECDMWYDSEDIVFPDLQQDDIKVKQFPMGTHYYAYVGSLQVRDGNTLKWDTYEEAYNHAIALIKKED